MTPKYTSQTTDKNAIATPCGRADDADVAVGRVVHGTFGAIYRVPMMIDPNEASTDDGPDQPGR